MCLLRTKHPLFATYGKEKTVRTISAPCVPTQNCTRKRFIPFIVTKKEGKVYCATTYDGWGSYLSTTRTVPPIKNACVTRKRVRCCWDRRAESYRYINHSTRWRFVASSGTKFASLRTTVHKCCPYNPHYHSKVLDSKGDKLYYKRFHSRLINVHVFK